MGLIDELDDGEEFTREKVAQLRAKMGEEKFERFCDAIFAIPDIALEGATPEQSKVLREFKVAVVQ